jgi:polysaccharide biosynthesis protein PelD
MASPPRPVLMCIQSLWPRNRRAGHQPWLLEFIVILSMLLLVAAATPIGWQFGSISPNPLWIPVLLLSSQYGTIPGIAAAMACMALHWVVGAPSQAGGEDVYDYLYRVWREPLLWPVAAVVIGGFRDQHALKLAVLRSRLLEADARVLSIGNLAEKLRSHCDDLERQIACAAERSIEAGLAALDDVHRARPEELKPALQQAMEVLVGPASYLLMTLRDGRFVIDPELFSVLSDARKLPRLEGLPADLEAELLRGQRLLSIRRAKDVSYLADVALIAAPILSPVGDRVIGVLVVQTMDPMRLTQETERAIGMLCRELSHALSREPILIAFKRERLPPRLASVPARGTTPG